MQDMMFITNDFHDSNQLARTILLHSHRAVNGGGHFNIRIAEVLLLA